MQHPLSFLFFILFFSSQIAYGQSVSKISPTTQVDTSVLTLNLDEFVIRGNKWEGVTHPVSVEVLDAKKAQLLAPNTTADLIGASGQVFLQKSQLGGGSPMMRGMAANRILLVYNGVRMNNAIFRSGNVQSAILVDPHMLATSEVHLGANSLLFGSDAMGGVIHFQSIEPQFSDSLTVSGTVKSQYQSAANSGVLHGRFGLSLPRFSFQVNHTHSKFGDLTMGKNGAEELLRSDYVIPAAGKDSLVLNPNPRIQIGSGYSQKNTGFHARWKPTKNTQLEYEYAHTASPAIPRYDRLIQKENNLEPTYAEWSYGPEKWIFHRLALSNEKSRSLWDGVRVNFAYQRVLESRKSRPFGGLETKLQQEDVTVLSSAIDFQKKWNTVHLHYGWDIQHNTIYSVADLFSLNTSSYEETQTRYPHGSTYLNQGGYLKSSWFLSSQHEMEYGIRVNQFSYAVDLRNNLPNYPFAQTEQQHLGVSGNFSYFYTPTPHLKLNFISNLAFRAPNIDDLGKLFDSEPGKVIVPNTQLQPEKAWNNEVGIEYRKGNIQLSAGTYYTFLTDLIARSSAQLNGSDSILYDGTLSEIQTLTNNDKGFVAGYYLNGRIQWSKSLHSQVQFSHQKGQQKSGQEEPQPLRHVAPSFGTVQLGYRKNNVTLLGEYQFARQITYDNLAQSEKNKPHLYEKDRQGNPYSPAWSIVNVKGVYALAENYVFNFGIENILNQRYRPYSSGIAAPGRNFILGFTMNL